ncbi:MFS transporter [Stenotrophomonas sp. PS02298]|uniref:MFS transporter n=1 Tax=Stenotrophomonas sp. PS02298 TaxID=2991424 RepID=UPI002499BA0E|nr:MFS transporter [Stenotrophomonas sp. PS02298]
MNLPLESSLEHREATTQLPGNALPAGLVWLFAIASGLCVANVYYAQPLLDLLAVSLGISQAAVGSVVTATQIGSALALLLLVPLGDRLERRRLMLGQLLALVVALLWVASAQSPWLLLLGMLAVGLLGTAMTQGLIAYAASAAGDGERGRVVGAAQAGVFIGLLMARVVAGGVADLGGWRSVYVVAALAMLLLAGVLYRRLPRLPASAVTMRYPQLLGSMLQLLRQDRVLQIRGMLALLMFAAFNIFWSALVLPLSAPPYGYSHTAIGAFGLVGVIGALGATGAGRWVDRGRGQAVTAMALLVLLLAWWPLSLMPVSLWALALGIVLLDLGGQALHVSNQSLILREQPQAHSRLVGLYMLFYAVGSGAGAIATTAMYAQEGWTGVCVLGAATCGVAGVFWLFTRRYMPEQLR